MTGTTGRMIGVTSSRLLRHHWYPVVRSSDLRGSPRGLRLLGRDLVVWRAPGGDVVAAPDRCTHRMAELSAGVVTDGVLSCPSHGWLFGDGGQCLRAGMTGDIPDNAHLRTVASAERYGLVWVCLEDPVAAIPELGPTDVAPVALPVDRWKVVATRLTERIVEALELTADDVTLPFVSRVPADGAGHAVVVVTPFDDFHSGVTAVAWPAVDGGDSHSLDDVCRALLDRVGAALDAAGSPVPPIEGGAGAEWRARLEAAVAAS